MIRRDHAKWVTKSKCMELTGYTANQIRSKIDRGLWVKGVHFTVADNERLINMDEVLEWTESYQETSTPEAVGRKKNSTSSSSLKEEFTRKKRILNAAT